MNKDNVTNGFAEKINKFYIITGLIMLTIYCTGLIGLFHSSLLIELVFVFSFFKVYFEMIEDCKNQIKKIILYTLCGFAIMFVAEIITGNILESILYQIFGYNTPQNSNNDYLLSMMKKLPVLFPLLCSVFGPILEETIYRFSLFRTLYEKNHFAAHFITALLFGMQHIFRAVFLDGQYIELINLFSYMVTSLILSLIYAKCKNLLPCILIHIFINTIGIIFMLM